MTSTTTWEAIRNQQAALIKALTPLKQSASKFLEFNYGELAFDEWAGENASAALRRFEIVDTGIYEQPAITNSDIELAEGGTTVRVAYPHLFGIYGPNNRSDMRELIDADRRQIADTMNALDSYISGQQRSQVPSGGITVTALERVTILEIEVEMTYYRSNQA